MRDKIRGAKLVWIGARPAVYYYATKLIVPCKTEEEAQKKIEKSLEKAKRNGRKL